MFSIELAIIIPILILLIVTALMMFQFATELGVFELTNSRAFMLSLSESASLNERRSRVTISQETYQVVRTLYVHDAHQIGLNAFEILNGRSTYTFDTKFYAMKSSRIALSFIKTGYDALFNMDR